MEQGLMLIGLPEVTVHVVQAIARKTGSSMVNVLGTAVHQYAKATLTEEDLLAVQAVIDKSRPQGQQAQPPKRF